jgi:SulP family sulfate permease
VLVYRLEGPLFFGAAAAIGAVFDRIGDRHAVLVLDMGGVPVLDSTGAQVIEGLARKAARRGGRVYVAGAPLRVARALALQVPHGVTQVETVAAALADWRGRA